MSFNNNKEAHKEICIVGVNMVIKKNIQSHITHIFFRVHNLFKHERI